MRIPASISCKAEISRTMVGKLRPIDFFIAASALRSSASSDAGSRREHDVAAAEHGARR
jgi:hypothetical protein